MNRSGQRGTAAETAVVRAIAQLGFPHAERRRLRGRDDAGDITGTPGVCWEVKGGNAARNASDAQVAAWLDETERERVNAGADVGVLVLQRAGKGAANAGQWWALFRSWQPPYPPPDGGPAPVVRMTLADACLVLRVNDFGTPLDEEGAA